MQVEKWNPWKEFTTLQQEVNRLFNSFFSRVAQTQALPDIAFVPPVDIYETETELVVRVALPGVLEEDIDVSLKGETLTIRGERDCPMDAKNGGYYHQEWRYGLFERVIVLPIEVREEAIKATLTDGVLEIRLSKNQR